MVSNFQDQTEMRLRTLTLAISVLCQENLAHHIYIHELLCI